MARMSAACAAGMCGNKTKMKFEVYNVIALCLSDGTIGIELLWPACRNDNEGYY